MAEPTGWQSVYACDVRIGDRVVSDAHDFTVTGIETIGSWRAFRTTKDGELLHLPFHERVDVLR